MGLAEYSRKRKFDQTPEPKPDKSRKKSGTRGGFFCVQRHDASHLHYDFRLEVNGVLVSWAVPKGPSLDPARKALAMKVEDHPLAYGTFEGNIPAGNYGGGSVMLWDKGSYEVMGEPDASGQLERGDFKFQLNGTKLKGAFAIVRMKRGQKGNEWLLIKKPDEYAVPDYDIDQFAWSVATKRTQEQIANEVEAISAADLPGAQKAAFPTHIEPMLATAVTKLPKGAQWLYEIKWDGVRAMCFIHKGSLKIESRRGNRSEKQYPELHHLPELVDAETAVLDGEICVLDEEGRARFKLIQPRIGANPKAVPHLAESSPATLFLFDVLYADGYNLQHVPLQDRKRLLKRLVTPDEHIRISETFDSDGEHIFESAKKMGIEGILAKDRHSSYETTRSKRWLKLKVVNEQEFVIAGFMEGEREHFGALVLGVQEEDGLRHVGQVGTGFDQKMMKSIAKRLEPLITRTSPFVQKPKLKDVTWVKPEVVCQVRFLEWTEEGMLRAPVFVALRDDKTADEVERETALEEEMNDEQLNLKGKEATVEVDGHTLKFTNLDKVFYPKDGWKKRDLIEFYDRVAHWLLPHLKDRPLSLKRYPNGIEAPYFFQKDAKKGFPEWIQCELIREGNPPKDNHYVIANDKATLLYLTNLGCIDQNPWMSRVGSLEHPDWMLIDLDPVDADFNLLVEAAQLVRQVLSDLSLKGYPKTTGGDGMHVYVPLEPVYTYDHVRSFAEIVAHLVVARKPDLFTTPRSVDKRKKGRVYFDYLQIGTGKTIAAPYVLRAHPKAPVATPLAWDEVKRGLKPTNFRIDNTIDRFERVGDLFAPVLKGGQKIEKALKLAQEQNGK